MCSSTVPSHYVFGREHAVFKPEAKVPPYQKLPQTSHHHPHTHPHAPAAQGHSYPAYNAASSHPRTDVIFSSPSVQAPHGRVTYEAAKHHVPPPPHVPHEQLSYQQKHPPYPYRLPPEYYAGSHRPAPNVSYPGYAHPVLPRPEHHQFPKANIAIAHEAASKGDVTTLVSGRGPSRLCDVALRVYMNLAFFFPKNTVVHFSLSLLMEKGLR